MSEPTLGIADAAWTVSGQDVSSAPVSLDAGQQQIVDAAVLRDAKLEFRDAGPPDDAASDPDLSLDSASLQDSTPDHGGVAPDMAPPAEPEYQAIVFDVEAAVLSAALGQPADCRQYDYLGGRQFEGTGDCHIQGIARTRDALITSCQDFGRDTGFLQLYGDGPEDYGRQSAHSPEWTSLYNRLHSHPVVGQGLPGTNLVPVVSSDDRATAARVDVRDGSVPICTFEHRPLPGFRSGDLHLGAGALTVHNERVHLLTCSWNCDSFFVYELDLNAENCAPTIISQSELRIHPRLLEDGGAGDRIWGSYNAISSFRDAEGNVYLLASHTEWLDTWVLTGFGGADIRFRKVAKYRWGRNPARHGGNGTFWEGMSIERPRPGVMRIWAAPHDYGRADCGNNRSCMRAAYSCDVLLRQAPEGGGG